MPVEVLFEQLSPVAARLGVNIRWPARGEFKSELLGHVFLVEHADGQATVVSCDFSKVEPFAARLLERGYGYATLDAGVDRNDDATIREMFDEWGVFSPSN